MEGNVQQTYLNEPIVIDGNKIGLTPYGLKKMIEHYEQCMSIATPQQMDDNVRSYCKQLVEKYKFHLVLYEKQNKA
jgi:hypothetical protein